jgi:hypothetical protein
VARAASRSVYSPVNCRDEIRRSFNAANGAPEALPEELARTSFACALRALGEVLRDLLPFPRRQIAIQKEIELFRDAGANAGAGHAPCPFSRRMP